MVSDGCCLPREFLCKKHLASEWVNKWNTSFRASVKICSKKKKIITFYHDYTVHYKVVEGRGESTQTPTHHLFAVTVFQQTGWYPTYIRSSVTTSSRYVFHEAMLNCSCRMKHDLVKCYWYRQRHADTGGCVTQLRYQQPYIERWNAGEIITRAHIFLKSNLKFSCML